MKNFL